MGRELRLLRAADIDGCGAAVRERAAGLEVGEARRAALEGHKTILAGREHVRNRAEQAHRVGHVGLGEDLVDSALLHELAGVHDRDAIDVASNDAEVVGNKHDGSPRDFLGLLKNLENLRLDGYVESGRRLVGDDELRVVRHRNRDHRALAHAARELVRECLHTALCGRDTHDLQKFDRACTPCLRTHVRVVKRERFLDLLPDRVDRREGAQRVLEDHRNFATAKVGELAIGLTQERLTAIGDFARDFRRRGQKAHDGHRAHGLTRA